jgi:hypothetical protein
MIPAKKGHENAIARRHFAGAAVPQRCTHTPVPRGTNVSRLRGCFTWNTHPLVEFRAYAGRAGVIVCSSWALGGSDA